MSGSFFFGEHVVFVSNRRLTSLTEFVLEVAASIATTSEDRLFVDRFEARTRAFFPGIDVDLEEQFTTLSERAFWASAFSELANCIERREIGNPDQHDWRSSATSEAQRIAAMLRTEC